MTPSPETATPIELVLDGASLTWREIELVLTGAPLHISLSEVARTHMSLVRASALEQLDANPNLRIYGWNQGLGPLKDFPLGADEQERFQVNVLRSHHAGMGQSVAVRIARLALIVRANSLARGTAGVRPELVQRMIDLLNAQLTPVMPSTGSLGTGDLQAMAAAGLALTGDTAGLLTTADGQVLPAAEALDTAGVETVFVLEAGEAIGLISGSPVLASSLAEATYRIGQQVLTFIGSFGLFCEASRAEKTAFDLRMHRERHIPAEVEVTQQILALVGDSTWGTAAGRARLGEVSPRIQDATSVRSVPHQLAAVVQDLERARLELEREVNASTCNPILVQAPAGHYEFLSGGNWDATVLGHTAHSLNVSVTRLAVLAKDLSGRLTHDGWSYGLPASLSGGALGINSGMTLLHTTGAALIPEMQVRANPVSTLSFPVKGGQEDHNTMAMASIYNLRSNIGRFDTLLAILLLLSAQGIYLLAGPLAGLAMGQGSTQIYNQVRTFISPLDEDRALVTDVEIATHLVSTGTIARVSADAIEAGAEGREGNYVI